jgi:hypothetical protein
MPQARSGDLPASMAILGLLVQRSDTASGVGVRLTEMFPRAQWSRTSVHKNIPGLVKQRLVRLVAKGAEPGLDCYEATTRGIARFRAWISESTAVSPPMRDAFQGRLSFVEQDELDMLIETVRQAEAAYRIEYAGAQGRVKGVSRSMRRSSEVSSWQSKLEFIQSGDEAMLLGMMFRRLQKLGDELERLLEEYSAPGHGV